MKQLMLYTVITCMSSSAFNLCSNYDNLVVSIYKRTCDTFNAITNLFVDSVITYIGEKYQFMYRQFGNLC
jgi:hypothetical protein